MCCLSMASDVVNCGAVCTRIYFFQHVYKCVCIYFTYRAVGLMFILRVMVTDYNIVDIIVPFFNSVQIKTKLESHDPASF